MSAGSFFDLSLGMTAHASSAVSPGAYGRWIQESGAGEWFVLAHLGFFFLLLACFGWATWRIWRRTTRPEPHVQLLMELAEGDSGGEAQVGGKNQGEVNPWERSADWWKNSNS
jgi:hypothetical protein